MYNQLKSIGKQLLAVAKQDWRRLKRIWKALPIRTQLIVRIAFYPVILISLLYLTVSILGFFKIATVSAWLGTFGDFVGGITNPIFSFLAFLGLLWTIKQQRDELGISREELRLTREELAKSADAQELHAQTAIEQQKLIQLQQFESTFFSLLANHEVALGKATEDVQSAVNLVRNSDLSDNCRHFNFHEFQGLVSYFIVLYQILKFVDESTLSSYEEKKKYTSLLRAYLPSDILILLTFNCYVDYKGISELYNNFKHYKLLVERYSMLEHLSWSFVNNKNMTSSPILLNSYDLNGCAFGLNVKYAYTALERNLISHMLNFISNVKSIVDIDANIREIKSDKTKLDSLLYSTESRLNDYNRVVELLRVIESRDISVFYDNNIQWRYLLNFESTIKNNFPDIEIPHILNYDEHRGVASVEQINEKLLASVDYMLDKLVYIKRKMEGLHLEAEKENLKEKIELCDKDIEDLVSTRMEESIKQVDIMANSFFAQCRESSILSHAMDLYLQEQKQNNYPAIRTPNEHMMIDIHL